MQSQTRVPTPRRPGPRTQPSTPRTPGRAPESPTRARGRTTTVPRSDRSNTANVQAPRQRETRGEPTRGGPRGSPPGTPRTTVASAASTPKAGNVPALWRHRSSKTAPPQVAARLATAALNKVRHSAAVSVRSVTVTTTSGRPRHHVRPSTPSHHGRPPERPTRARGSTQTQRRDDRPNTTSARTAGPGGLRGLPNRGPAGSRLPEHPSTTVPHAAIAPQQRHTTSRGKGVSGSVIPCEKVATRLATAHTCAREFNPPDAPENLEWVPGCPGARGCPGGGAKIGFLSWGGGGPMYAIVYPGPWLRSGPMSRSWAAH